MFQDYCPGGIIADDVHFLSLLLLRAPLDELIRAVPHGAMKTAGGGKKTQKICDAQNSQQRVTERHLLPLPFSCYQSKRLPT